MALEGRHIFEKFGRFPVTTQFPEEKTLPKALRTQALTALTSNFGLVGLVRWVLLSRFGLVCLVW